MNFKVDNGAKECYRFYKEREKTRAVINNRSFKNRIIKYKRSQKNPKTGGWFISPNGSPDNSGRRFDEPIDLKTFLELKPQKWDRFYFERGGIYCIGDYDITVNNITLSSYGTGAKPIIRGATDISGLTWTDIGSGVYTTPMAQEPNWIWINGECAKLAETARIPVLSRFNTTSADVAHGQVSAYSSIVGSYLVIKEKDFQNSQKVTVTGYDGAGRITFAAQPIPSTLNVDLVLYNNTEYFSGNNEWAWESGTLYVKAAASPSTLDIRVGAYDYCFKTTGTLTVDNIEFKEFYQFAVWCDGGTPTISDCSFHDIRDTSVFIQRGVTGASITDNTFLRIGNNAIATRPCTNLTITGNTFTDIAMQANYNWQTWHDGDDSIVINGILTGGCGIAYIVDLEDDTIDGSNAVIEYNTFTNLAYCGVLFGLGTTHRVRFNIVSDFMARYHDGGGIYTFHYRAQNVPIENCEIAYNIVFDDNANSEGVGIYLDNRTRAANVHHNTIYNCNWGLVLNYDTTDHTIEDNNINDCVYGVVIRQWDFGGGFLYTDNINNQFNRNTIGCTHTGQKCIHFSLNYSEPTWNPYSGTGGADDNMYIKPQGTDTDIADSDNKGANLTLTELRTAYGEDAASNRFQEVPHLFVNTTNAILAEDAESDYLDLAGSPVGTFNIDPFYSRILTERKYSNSFVAASSQYFNAGTSADIQFSHVATFSISFWFKIAANPAATQFLITNQNASTSRGYGVAMTSSGTFIVNLVNTVATNRAQITTAVDKADNAWHHFFFCLPGSAASAVIYIDGASAGTVFANNLSATIESTDDLLIGALNGPSNFWNGLIDEVAIWNSVKTSNVAAIYSRGKTHDLREDHPPLHYWRMGEAGSLIDGVIDLGTSATDMNLTNVNGVTASTDAP